MRVRAIAVAHPDHPLHQLGRELTHRDLRQHRHIFIRDSGSQRTRSPGFQGAEQRWTVSHKATFIRALRMGLGYAWFPEDALRTELEEGSLKELPLREGGEKFAELYLVFADRDYAGRDAQRLAEIIRGSVDAQCLAHKAALGVARGAAKQGGLAGKRRRK
jgi:DNA-binding transcriptional LysR family regulator